MKTKLTILMALLSVSAGAQTFTNIWLPGAWPATTWWTNTPPLTNVVSSNAWQAVNENFKRASNALAVFEGTLADADTNALVNSYRVPLWTSNSISISAGGTNFMGWVTNLAGVDFTASLGQPKLIYSLDGTTWQEGSTLFVTNAAVEVGFRAQAYSVGADPTPIPMPAGLSNVTAWVMTRPDLFGRTNALVGERLFLSAPTDAGEAATKGYVDATFTSTAWWSAGGDVQVNGHALNLSATWAMTTSANTNQQGFALSFLGETLLSATAGNPVNAGLPTVSVDGTGTNVIVTLATNGLSSVPRIEFTHSLSPLDWRWLTNAAAVAGTNYSWTFPMPYPDMGFLMTMIASASPGLIGIPGVIQLAPRTIATSNATTWGQGAGILCADSNYIYISVGTNSWHRLVGGW